MDTGGDQFLRDQQTNPTASAMADDLSLRDLTHPALNDCLKSHNAATFKLVKTGKSLVCLPKKTYFFFLILTTRINVSLSVHVYLFFYSHNIGTRENVLKKRRYFTDIWITSVVFFYVQFLFLFFFFFTCSYFFLLSSDSATGT